ncbi:hypothetical protein [Vibrio parahaemolyticus]|uniref:hypothetical protein n=1 Tax=Vibrio parahaemolyticus TaxID=670 RepID=UPI00235E198C|nr:hypothetical protein [Vibrio parahaemolyticus]
METSSVLGLVTTSSFVGMLVGGLIGHRLALGRDKRKEYNDAIRPLKSLVSKTSRSPLKGSLTRESIDAVEHYVSPRVYVKLVEALNEYREKMAETTQTDGWGVPYMDEEDKVEVRAILTKMDKLLKVK